MTMALLREEGIEDMGVMDPDPYSAIHGRAGRGEVRRDHHLDPSRGRARAGAPRLGRRVHRAGTPVEHVVVDHDSERDDVKRTLVVANQTVGGGS